MVLLGQMGKAQAGKKDLLSNCGLNLTVELLD
jgi:hypothetical protein